MEAMAEDDPGPAVRREHCRVDFHVKVVEGLDAGCGFRGARNDPWIVEQVVGLREPELHVEHVRLPMLAVPATDGFHGRDVVLNDSDLDDDVV
jgi:hypothetical protein